MKKNQSPSPTDPTVERRESKRRAVLSQFSIFLLIPKHGIHKLAVHNLSESGILFEFDTENESIANCPIQVGDELESKLYINSSLYIPLYLKLARIENHSDHRKIGASFYKKDTEEYRTFIFFLHVLDGLSKINNTQSN